MKINVRAGTRQEATLKDEHRWFHVECFRKDNCGFKFPIDFPSEARSDATCCFGCGAPINVEVVSIPSRSNGAGKPSVLQQEIQALGCMGE